MRLTVLSAMSLFLCGCASYRVIDQSDHAGHIYVENTVGHGLAMTRAFNFIREKCPKGYLTSHQGQDENGHFYEFNCKK